MTRKHYQMVADVLHRELTDHQGSLDAVQNIAAGLADAFKADNPRFDRDRFMKAVTG